MVKTNTVRDAFSHLDTAEIEYSTLAGGVRVTVSDSEAGEFFKTLRTRDFNARSKRLGDTLVAHIEAERQSLSDLFS